MKKDYATVTVNPFEKERFRVDYLKEMYDDLLTKRKNYTHSYERTGEHQRKDWRTGELLFNEDGTPRMEGEYEYIAKDSDEIDEEDALRITVIDELLNELVKLM